MKKLIKDRFERKLEKTNKKINDVDARIKELLNEPRSVVSHILNNLYDEKDQLIAKKENIERILKNVEDTDVVNDLKKVTVKVNGKEKTLYLVQDHYVDPRNGFISHNSPIGEAIKDKKPGDSFSITTPLGLTQYQLIGI